MILYVNCTKLILNNLKIKKNINKNNYEFLFAQDGLAFGKGAWKICRFNAIGCFDNASFWIAAYFWIRAHLTTSLKGYLAAVFENFCWHVTKLIDGQLFICNVM